MTHLHPCAPLRVGYELNDLDELDAGRPAESPTAIGHSPSRWRGSRDLVRKGSPSGTRAHIAA